MSSVTEGVASDAATHRRTAGEAERALALTRRAAAASNVLVRTVDAIADHHRAAAVLQQIWEHPHGGPLSPEMLRAFAYTGNYVGAAFDGDEIVGVATAFRTDHGALHSHIAGVLPSHQGRSIGYVLKLHQRAWALQRAIPAIAWTFDPLIRRNAHFNLIKLGARVSAYLPDFYGPMTDGINADDHSDRLLVEWDLLGPVPGRPVTAGDDAVTVLRPDVTGGPIAHPATSADRVIALPEDIEALRRNDSAAADEWREALRAALADAFGADHRIIGLDEAGAYVTRRYSP